MTIVISGCACDSVSAFVVGTVDGTPVTARCSVSELTGDDAAKRRTLAQLLLDTLKVEQTALHGTVTL